MKAAHDEYHDERESHGTERAVTNEQKAQQTDKRANEDKTCEDVELRTMGVHFRRLFASRFEIRHRGQLPHPRRELL